MSDLSVVSPIAGWLTSLDAVPDPVFSGRMLGDGVAIDPVEGIVRSPFAGRVATIHAARHAITIESDLGAMLLIHIGLETVALGGAGFRAEVSEGARVAAGDPLIAFDLDAIGQQARSLVTPIILLNGDAFMIEAVAGDRMIAAGDPLFRLIPRDTARPAGAVEGEQVERTLMLPLRHGIHARPAARIAELARGFDASVEIVSADGRSASARSPVAMLALALPHGAVLRIRGIGGQRVQAVEALAELIAGGMGEGAPVALAAATPLPPMLRGVVAVPGMATGAAFHLKRAQIDAPEEGAGMTEESAALQAALDRLRGELAATATGEDAAAAIAAAHIAFLSDPDLLATADAGIAAGHSAGFAWRGAIERFAVLLAGAGGRFAERIDDLRDLEERVLAALHGEAADHAIPPGAILLAAEIFPSQVMALAGRDIAGIATARGGPTSHAAIIAAGLGLPMLVALGSDVERIDDGTLLHLDAVAGILYIDPSPELLAEKRVATEASARFREEAGARSLEEAVTIDGTRIELFANLGSLVDAHAAVAAGAEGCGLLRTEFLFLDRSTPPDEEEQRAACQAIADALDGRPLIVRTLDIGADKPAPYLALPVEENPALGVRGLRLGLAHPALMESQLRALLRLKGDIRIMLPMVVEPGEVAGVRAMIERIAREFGQGVPPLGIMIETPAAAMLAGPLARVADFFSIGSNDLTQYALAMDRGNPAVAAGLDGLHPAVLRLIAMTVAGACSSGRWTGVCGGIAADPLAVPVLLGLGITELSVPPALIAETKERVRRIGLEACRALAIEALAQESASAVRSLALRFVEERQGA